MQPLPTVAAKQGTSSLRNEITLIDRALAALQRRDTNAARIALDAYDRQFPTGIMAPEAAVARIELSLATGDKTTARALAKTFLLAHPTSPLAARVRSLVGDHAP